MIVNIFIPLYILLTTFLSCFYSNNSQKPELAMKNIFPESTIEIKNIILTSEQISKSEKLSGVKLENKLISFYLAQRNNQTIGYGYVDIHNVRTQPEVVLYAINPNGEIVKTEILSFKEPPEYMPSEKWLSLFINKSLEKNDIILRKDIAAISGSTLTARAITNHCRRALSLWKVIFSNNNNEILHNRDSTRQ